jgi:hypothetical protein
MMKNLRRSKMGKNKLKCKEFVFEDDRPFLSCHASTLVELDNGDTLAAWFGGTAEKNPDTAIWYSRRKDGNWSYPQVLADEEGIAFWNPVLFKAPDGRVFLYYKVGENDSKWYTKYIVSNDDGISWNKPEELVPGDIGGRGPVKKLQSFLGFASAIEYQYYPVNAKYYMQLEGLGIELESRSRDVSGFDTSYRYEIEYLHSLSKEYARELGMQ